MKPLLHCLLLVVLTGSACRKTDIDPDECPFVIKNTDATYTYRFDKQGRLIHLALNSATNDVDYSYAYQAGRATIDITYPRPGADWLRFHYDVTLSEQGYLTAAQETMYNRLADGTTQERLMTSHTCAYDNEGHLATHHLNSFKYPPNQARVVDTFDEQFGYENGNPVLVSFTRSESGLPPVSGQITNQYGTELNSLPITFFLEANSFGFSLDDALKPLLGKPSRTLLICSVMPAITFSYAYTFDSQKRLIKIARSSGTTPYAVYTISNSCL